MTPAALIAALIAALRKRGAQLAADGDRLVVRGPGEVMTTELARHLRALKPEVIAHLQQQRAERGRRVTALWADAYRAINTGCRRFDASESELRRRFPAEYAEIDAAEDDSRVAADRWLHGDDTAEEPLRAAINRWRSVYETVARQLAKEAA